MKDPFDLFSYDCIGFDLDHTLVEYEEIELIQLTYNCLANIMIKKNNYDPKHLLKPVLDDIDFLRKGLTLDTEKGNVVNLGHDGTVLRASHGTRTLSKLEIEKVYGPDKKWDLAVNHCGDLLMTWNGDVSEKIRSSLDYFDMCVPLLFARTIDCLDEGNDYKSWQTYDSWRKILGSLYKMYRKENFVENTGGYYEAVKQDPLKYLRKRSPQFLQWLGSVKQSSKITFLITGSDYDYGDFTATNVLGDDWKKYFDVIIFYAKKPGFFVQRRDFKSTDTPNNIPNTELKINACYREGNWTGLYELFKKVLNMQNPKCLYIGDNLIQDVYAPAKFNCCDTVAIVKELANYNGPESKLFKSETWGSMTFDEKHQESTIWGNVLDNYSQLSVPSIEWFLAAK